MSRWHAAPRDEYCRVVWDDQAAIFHRPSGQTHFVNAATDYILTQVLHTPAGVAEVVTALNGLRGPELVPIEHGQVAGLLRRLEEIGLIRRVDTDGHG